MEWVAALIAAFFSALAALLPAHTLSFEAPQLPFVSHEATVLFGGDMLFDRTIRAVADEKGGDFLFSCIDPTLQDADLTIANLEGPITSTSSRSLGSAIASSDNYVFTFPTSTGALLAAHHVGVVNIGNNHITNFGVSGVRSTIQNLTDAGVQYFGDPIEQRVAEVSVHGVSLAFINYNEFERASSASTTISQIETARGMGEIPIVYTHWGVEYATTSSLYMQSLAHAFVDAGAALVVGSHPHVVEEHEHYHGADIYYSLGNFIFDQYWNDAVRHGLLLRVSFDEGGVASVEEIPVELDHDRRTCPST